VAGEGNIDAGSCRRSASFLLSISPGCAVSLKLVVYTASIRLPVVHEMVHEALKPHASSSLRAAPKKCFAAPGRLSETTQRLRPTGFYVPVVCTLRRVRLFNSTTLSSTSTRRLARFQYHPRQRVCACVGFVKVELTPRIHVALHICDLFWSLPNQSINR